MESRLFPLRKREGFDYGESKIYTTNDGIYKEFASNISQATRRKKKERLLYLEQYESLKEYYPEIKYFVELIKNWYIQGYVMKEVHYTELDSSKIFFKQKIEILRKVREFLEALKSIGLYYYDIHLGNICLNENGSPIFFDIDSILFVDEKKPDIRPSGLSEFKRFGGELGDEFQRIKFNILTRNALAYNQGRDFEYDEVGTEMIDAADKSIEFQHNGPLSDVYLLDHVLKKIK